MYLHEIAEFIMSFDELCQKCHEQNFSVSISSIKYNFGLDKISRLVEKSVKNRRDQNFILYYLYTQKIIILQKSFVSGDF